MIRRFARPYARAIMDVTGTPEKAAAILAELERFEEMRRSAPDLRELYANPGFDAPAKIAITAKIAGRSGLSELSQRVLDVLIRNHRINDLGSINAALSAYVNEAMGVMVAEVRSAHALSKEEVAELQKTLEKRVGKRVQARVTTDPSLLGGFVARLGSEIYDASVSGKIEKFRESLA
jgi:F-type H+-transporting ATPase subunit delta